MQIAFGGKLSNPSMLLVLGSVDLANGVSSFDVSVDEV